MKFSAKYPTYNDWREAQQKNSSYAKQIDRLHVQYPQASLSQLRRHPTEKQEPLTKLTKKHGRLPPIESLTELQQDRYERSLEAIRYMRRYGLSLAQAAQRVNLSPETVKHMAGKAMEISNVRYIAKPHDRCERIMLFYDEHGPIPIKIRSSKTASLMGKYHAAVKKYTETGDFSGVLNFEGKSITDAFGIRYEFITQRKLLDEFIRSGEVRFESIYQYTL